MGKKKRNKKGERDWLEVLSRFFCFVLVLFFDVLFLFLFFFLQISTYLDSRTYTLCKVDFTKITFTLLKRHLPRKNKSVYDRTAQMRKDTRAKQKQLLSRRTETNAVSLLLLATSTLYRKWSLKKKDSAHSHILCFSFTAVVSVCLYPAPYRYAYLTMCLSGLVFVCVNICLLPCSVANMSFLSLTRQTKPLCPFSSVFSYSFVQGSLITVYNWFAYRMFCIIHLRIVFFLWYVWLMHISYVSKICIIAVSYIFLCYVYYRMFLWHSHVVCLYDVIN